MSIEEYENIGSLYYLEDKIRNIAKKEDCILKDLYNYIDDFFNYVYDPSLKESEIKHYIEFEKIKKQDILNLFKFYIAENIFHEEYLIKNGFSFANTHLELCCVNNYEIYSDCPVGYIIESFQYIDLNYSYDFKSVVFCNEMSSSKGKKKKNKHLQSIKIQVSKKTFTVPIIHVFTEFKHLSERYTR